MGNLFLISLRCVARLVALRIDETINLYIHLEQQASEILVVSFALERCFMNVSWVENDAIMATGLVNLVL